MLRDSNPTPQPQVYGAATDRSTDLERVLQRAPAMVTVADGAGSVCDAVEHGGADDANGSGGKEMICSSFIPSCSNFSIQYNYACASIATSIMLSHNDETGAHATPDYSEPGWAKDGLLGMVFIGSALGMLIMGYLGDLLGLRPATILTNVFIVVGALASALLSWGSASTVWTVIAVSRVVLGVGIGGAYPLSAKKAAEGGPSEDAAAKAGAAFFWQGPGAVAPYAFALCLLNMPHVQGVTSVQFRALLGFGAAPALIVLLATLREPPMLARGHAQGHVDGDGAPAGGMSHGLRDSEHWWTLLGTGGSWFLFDVAFYGTVIFSPVILADVFGPNQSLKDMAKLAALMNLVSTFGYLCGLMALPFVGPKRLNVMGLSASALLFVAFAIAFSKHREAHIVLFSLLCLLIMSLSAGPAIATFILPVAAFPVEVRSTFHGLSAAAAKAGAMFGSLFFPICHEYIGVPGVMVLQAFFCAAGAVLSQLLISRAAPSQAEQKKMSGVSYMRPVEGQEIEMSREGDHVHLTEARDI